MWRRGIIVLALPALLAGCGGSSEELPPAAEPARSPAVAERPAGRVVRVGHKPEGIAVDPRTGLVAVGLKDPDRLALVDADSGRVVRRVPLPASPRHLQLGAPGGPVLVPAEKANALVEVSLPSGRRRVTRVGDTPHDAARARRRIFVADELGDTVSVVERGRRVRALDAPVQPGGVAATTDRRRVGVVGVSERALWVYDARSLRRVARLDVGVGPTHILAGVARFFVVDTRGDGLLEVRLGAKARIHRRTHLPGAPYGAALDRRRKRIWVTLTERNQVAELTDHRLLRVFPSVRQPNSVAVDPRDGRVFVASRTDGTLQLIDPP
jgi:DNA-binding beta-propeller fold protein YncE